MMPEKTTKVNQFWIILTIVCAIVVFFFLFGRPLLSEFLFTGSVAKQVATLEEGQSVQKHNNLGPNASEKNLTERINRLQAAIDTAIDKSDKISSLITTAMGFIFTIVIALITAIAVAFYFRGAELREEISKARNDLYITKGDLNGLIQRAQEISENAERTLRGHVGMQEELSHSNVVKYARLDEDIKGVVDDSFRDFMKKLVRLLQEFDGYQWAVANSFSSDPNRRLKALAKVATMQELVPTARDFLKDSLERFQGPRFQKERKVIMRGLG